MGTARRWARSSSRRRRRPPRCRPEGAPEVPPLTVAALGGNAIADPRDRGEAAEQRRNLRKAATALAEIVASGSRLVVTHGNGPQVGALLIQAEAAASEVPT